MSAAVKPRGPVTRQLIVSLPELHPTQQIVANCASRFIPLAAGRRWGKTRLGVYLSLREALSGPRMVWWVAPVYKTAEIGWRIAKALAGEIPATEVREADMLIRFPTGGVLQIRSGDEPRTLRGEGLDFIVLDEFAYMKPDVWTESIRPALSDRQGRALFISTPNGRNLFWELYQRGLDPAQRGVWQSFHFTTYDNPHVRPEEIDQAREQLPERIFRQEYLAEFIEDAGAVFRRVPAAAVAPVTSPEEHRGHHVVIGVDWGKLNDFTVLSAVCQNCSVQVDFDRFNRIDYELQEQRLYLMVRRWGGPRYVTVHAEENAMGPMLERLQRSGLNVRGFATTAASKPKLIESLALALERGELLILPDPVQVGELQAYTLTVNRYTNRPSYSAPEGGHDDTVMALALAWMLVETHHPPQVRVERVPIVGLFSSRDKNRQRGKPQRYRS